jgi:ribonucleoside-triphosphate reductase (formate)
MSDIVFDGFRKRDGSIVPFDSTKIQTALWKATWEIFRRETGIPKDLLPAVLARLATDVKEKAGKRIPTLEQVQDITLLVLNEAGHKEIARAYGDFRNARDKARKKIQVKAAKTSKGSVTDKNLLLVESGIDPVTSLWDRTKVVDRLKAKTTLDEHEICVIAKIVENRVIASGMTLLTSALIRELINTVLVERGHNTSLKAGEGVFVPNEYIESLLDTKCNENSNLANNNPEAVSLGISELVLKEWALDNIFTEDIKRAHLAGAIHLHDLGFPHRVYCSAHSIEFVKKYGLVSLGNLATESHPAKSASVLTGHLNTFLASMQANYAGALGLGYVNILYAPYLLHMTKKEYKQIAQELIFNGSQNAFSRGSSSIFLDFNIHATIPDNLGNVPVIGPGGKYLARVEGIQDPVPLTEVGLPTDNLMELQWQGKAVLREMLVNGEIKYDKTVEDKAQEEGVTVLRYRDYESEAMAFTEALLEVWAEGDKNGRIFPFPKCNFHVDQKTLTSPDHRYLYDKACQLSSKNGSTYFIFDRDAVTLAACCRLRTTIDDKRMLAHPELLSFCGFQNVTINIPQAAYRASKRKGQLLEETLKEIDNTMNLAMQAHLQKKSAIHKFMESTGPLYQVGKVWAHGRPYINLDKATYIIGIIGVNDAVKFITGKELHESTEAFDMGLKIIAHMYTKTKAFTEKYGLKITLEETPAESAARRLAKTDLALFPQEASAIIKGTKDTAFYTNSIHLSAEADVPLVERIRKQSMFHTMIESGAIIHAFVGEERPHWQAIAGLIERVYKETQSAQVVVSPEFTYCNLCQHQATGIKDKCPSCGCTDVDAMTRVVGYYSKVKNWNKSKSEGELPARQAGKYSV